MNFHFKFHNLDSSQFLKSFTEKKVEEQLSFLSRCDMDVTFNRAKGQHTEIEEVNILLSTHKGKQIEAKAHSDNMCKSVTKALNKIKKQALKHQKKIKHRKGGDNLITLMEAS